MGRRRSNSVRGRSGGSSNRSSAAAGSATSATTTSQAAGTNTAQANTPSYASGDSAGSVNAGAISGGGSSISLAKGSGKTGGSPKNRSGFPAASFYPVNDSGQPTGGPKVYCTFNPNKYSISVTNNFRTKGVDENQNYNMESDENSTQGRELSIGEIWFDASEGSNTQKGVTYITDLLMELAQMKDPDWTPPPPPEGQEGASGGAAGTELKPPPAKIAFHWGAFTFLGVIKSLTIEYVLFNSKGTPIRAKANIKLTEFKQENAQPKQNPSSGGGPLERLWYVKAGERLDHIAAEVYGDATRWRSIAIRNNIDDPFALRSGLKLAIPAY